MGSILIKNGRVWDGERFFDADVLTQEDKIAKIAPSLTESADYVLDATGKIVSPGFVDIHVHMRLGPKESLGIQPELGCIPFGVTAVADAGRTRAEQIVLDLLAVKNLIFVGVDIQNNQANLAKLEEDILRFGDRAVGIKVYFDTEVSEVSDISPLAQVCAFAKARNLHVMVHCSGSPTPMAEILHTLNAGDVLTHAFHGGCNNASEDDFVSMKAAQKRGVIIDTGFAGNVHTDFVVFEKALQAGIIPDTISSDITRFSGYIRGGRYGMTMCMSMARHMGMDEKDIFKAVTSVPAKVVGKSEEWGALQVGRRADIAVIDYTNEGFSITDKAGNHIKSEKGYRCVFTVVDGQIVYRD